MTTAATARPQTRTKLVSVWSRLAIEKETRTDGDNTRGKTFLASFDRYGENKKYDHNEDYDTLEGKR